MPLTLGQLREQVLLAIGGAPSTAPATADVTERDPHSSADDLVAQIINDAGELLMAERWGFRRRRGVEVPLVVDQEYVDLPADLGQLMSIRCDGTNGAALQVVSSDAIASLRQGATALSGTWPYVIAFVRADADAGEEFGALRGELFPTPTADANLELWYLARWIPVTSAMPNSWVVHVPTYVHQVLRALVRAVAIGHEDGGAEELVERVRRGSFWKNAWSADTQEHPIAGTERDSCVLIDPWANVNVGDPA